MAESPVARWRDWRPFEPDAGNAAEGSEGPMPLAMLAMRSSAHGYFVVERYNQENRNSGEKFLFLFRSLFPAFLIQIFYERE